MNPNLFSVAALVACSVHPTQAQQLVDPLRAACLRFDITTPARLACFLGQTIVESQGFTKLEENLYWSTPERIRQYFPHEVTSLGQAATLARNPQALANCVYANKNGNGNEASGDGWKYRGRGVIQLTGAHNYSDAQTELGRPYLDQPELVGQLVDACLTGAWFWSIRHLNLLADSSQWDLVTRAVAGPSMDQHQLRAQLSVQAVGVLCNIT